MLAATHIVGIRV